MVGPRRIIFKKIKEDLRYFSSRRISEGMPWSVQKELAGLNSSWECLWCARVRGAGEMGNAAPAREPSAFSETRAVQAVRMDRADPHAVAVE